MSQKLAVWTGFYRCHRCGETQVDHADTVQRSANQAIRDLDTRMSHHCPDRENDSVFGVLDLYEVRRAEDV